MCEALDDHEIVLTSEDGLLPTSFFADYIVINTEEEGAA